jgi:hypothetical protein
VFFFLVVRYRLLQKQRSSNNRNILYQEAVNMADLLPTKTQRTELLKLSQNVVASQSAEIQQMKS